MSCWEQDNGLYTKERKAVTCLICMLGLTKVTMEAYQLVKEMLIDRLQKKNQKCFFCLNLQIH